MTRKTLSLSFALGLSWIAAAGLAGAVELTVGNPSIGGGPGDAGYVNTSATLIDLSRPATATGVLTHVKFGWASPTCLSAHIKVFHRVGNTLTMTGQSTVDFSAPSGFNVIAPLTPALPIQQGDVLGISAVAPCFAGGLFLNVPFAGVFLSQSEDYSGTFSFTPLDIHIGGVALSAIGTTTEYRAGVIPAVGSGPGLHGASFVTSLQMIAPPIGGDVNGRLVFHPAGVGGSTGDPSLPIAISQSHAVSFADVVAAMGQTGFGSIDVVLSADSGVPVTFARVFNDQGDAGSSGVGEELVPDSGSFSSAGQVVPAGFTGYLSAPVDASKTRFNLGVRTLDSGAFITFVLKDASGNVKASAASPYPPDYFNQFHAEDLFGTALGSNDVVEVTVSTGSAIVFGSTTDNVTNDPSYQFVHPVFGVL